MTRVGVIGCGYWGPNLLRNLLALKNCEVAGACDKDERRRRYIETQYPGVRTTSDYHDFLADPDLDAVVIATPIRTHGPLACEFLQAGKHVFVEKPLAENTETALRMIRTAAAHGRRLMVGHTFIYSSPVRLIRDLIESGELGDILYINSRRLNLGLFQSDINVTWDLAPHDLSIILSWLDTSPKYVSCRGAAHFQKGIEDVTDLTLIFPDDVFVCIQSSWVDPRKVREMTIVGTKKMVVYDDTESLEKVRVYDKHVDTPPHYDTYAEFHFSYHYGDVSIPYLRQLEPLRVEMQHFLDCIGNGGACLSGGEEGLEVVRILERAHESLRTGSAQLPITEGAVTYA